MVWMRKKSSKSTTIPCGPWALAPTGTHVYEDHCAVAPTCDTGSKLLTGFCCRACRGESDSPCHCIDPVEEDLRCHTHMTQGCVQSQRERGLSRWKEARQCFWQQRLSVGGLALASERALRRGSSSWRAWREPGQLRGQGPNACLRSRNRGTLRLPALGSLEERALRALEQEWSGPKSKTAPERARFSSCKRTKRRRLPRQQRAEMKVPWRVVASEFRRESSSRRRRWQPETWEQKQWCPCEAGAGGKAHNREPQLEPLAVVAEDSRRGPSRSRPSTSEPAPC